MSLTALRAEPVRAPERTRHLSPVAAPAPRRRPRLIYAVIALAGAIAIAAAQLVLSFAATQDSFVLAELNAQQHQLSLEKQALQEQIVALGSPQVLASAAAEQGLVIAGSAGYLRLSDGTVLGAPDAPHRGATVNPNGAGQVGNALRQAPLAPPVVADTPAASDPAQLPPALTDGLPTPQTH